MARIGAFNPLLAGMGVTMIGPTILDHGTEELKRTHLPRIARGEVHRQTIARRVLAAADERCELSGRMGT